MKLILFLFAASETPILKPDLIHEERREGGFKMQEGVFVDLLQNMENIYSDEMTLT